jgi:hypothetical protein
MRAAWLDGFARLGSRRILPHDQQQARAEVVSKIETAVAGSDNLRCFYFFFSNEGIKDKLAALRQAGSHAEVGSAERCFEDYRKQMLAEMKKDIINSRTKQVEQRWVKIGGRPNHLWDCECIALASAMLAGVMPVGAES